MIDSTLVSLLIKKSGIARTMKAIPVFLLALLCFPLVTVLTRKQDVIVEIGEAYDPSSEGCCGSKPFYLVDHHSFYSCCGDDRYDQTSQICCENAAVHKLQPADHACCGKEYYNTKTHYCCKPDRYLRDIPEAFKSDESSGKFLQCCESETYDMRNGSCCNGKVMSKLTFTDSCCGDSVYNHRQQLCCNGTVMMFNETAGSNVNSRFHAKRLVSCCGATAYNVRAQMCCGGVLLNLDRTKICCGTALMVRLQQTCCLGIISDMAPSKTVKCCGDKSYDIRTHLCSSNSWSSIVVKKSNESDTACCGDTTYNSVTHVCCNSTAMQKRNPKDTHCCGKFTFNPLQEICCHDETINQHRAYSRVHGGQCCGIVPYFPRKESCVENFLVAKPGVPASKSLGSCGGKLFDSEKHTCCQNTVAIKEKADGVYQCCGTNAYIPAEQVCCKGTHVRNTTTPKQTACCIVRRYIKRANDAESNGRGRGRREMALVTGSGLTSQTLY